jgi:hypothetical protein
VCGNYKLGSTSIKPITSPSKYVILFAASNKMTLYHHFASKDELVAEYLREAAKETDTF